ncbi:MULTISPECIES: adenylate/guanylate cyclase domain-containing protein [unclassified Bradyrhizobium]|uniref:adenylate/guanylate cyclase domain-containing protein n=1 Tax=unclassified Bradyrhizobium TaxID=2631580 RepID=UPI001BAB785F|nr:MULTISPECIES: adenylate/guanylate cyclase domain-containing protein [unclassified Bradyrhizobium]MBR1224934.1 adenylate cyclase [Bradyrhizobium sp. AUGA SZCCT0176]MBR1301392.1 adenylate cyclase [Bradyrhizobium sp. AUGA SZCCT0042]
MSTAPIERHLTAIVAADVVGYSRLMGTDEKGTHLALKGHRKELVDPLIAAHKGHIVKTTGDGLLLRFPSIVEAVSCAVEMQSGMAKRNRDIAAGNRIEFRIGVHIGDVIVDKGDVFGDGVNIAARLEQIAPPGGICLSEDTYRQVRGKLDIDIADAGEQSLKNIANPIRVYRIEPSVAAIAGALMPPTERKRRWSMRAAAGAAMTVAAILTMVAWVALFRDRPDVARTSAPSKPIAVTAMPIIAVLPFANQTGDDGQDYFVDGATEEVINALGRFNTLRVIGRNAVLPYKKRPATQQEIASELGATYLVEGSVRRSASQVRITAQLTESRTGTVLWSDRFDGELADIFEFQDAIARRIAGTLAANIALVEGRRSLDQPKPNPNAFDLVLRARALGHASTRTVNRRFRELIAKAIELDPNYAMARALLAEALYSQALLGWTEFTDRELARGADEARKAIALAPDEPDGHRALGRIHLARAEYDQAQHALKRAIEINPSDVNALAVWGGVQSFSGQVAEAIGSLQLALKLDPTLEPSHVFDLALAYYLARQHEDALRIAERGLARYPDFPMFNLPAAAAAAQLGRKEQAARYVEALRRRLPFFETDNVGSRFKDPTHAAYLRDGLKAAGL